MLPTSAKRLRVAARIVALGAWLGIVYGLLEGIEVSALRLIPGALSWRNGNSANVLWFAPLFYMVVCSFIAAIVAVLALAVRRVSWDAVLVFVVAFGGAFLALTLPGRPLSELAAAVLALGIAAELTRQFQRRRTPFTHFALRSTPYLAAAVVVLAAVTIALPGIAERRALRAHRAPAMDRPNVLLLIIDTQRADHLSAYGYKRRTSPHLEQFAAEGVVFENAYSSSSWTLPTHASIMTGRPLHEHQAGIMRRPFLDKRYPTLAEQLKRAGYATGGFVANTFWTGRQTGLARGFVHYEDFWGNPGDAVARTALGRRLAYDVLPRFGLIDVPGRKYAAEINGDLLRWIDGVKDQPFFAFVNYFDVHGPYLPPRPYAGTYSKGPDEQEKKIDIGALTNDVVVPPADQLQHMVDRYDESILFLDAQLGRLFEALKQRNLLDRTIVIVTSDHGESWGEHDMMYHGHSLYREQLHVPLLLRFPSRIPAGQRVSQPVSVQQIPATVADLARVNMSVFPLASLLERKSDTVVAELAQRSTVAANWPSSRGWLTSVLTDRWQFTLYQAGDTQLFDIVEDPAQLHNLAADPNRADTSAQLQATLKSLSPAEGLDWRR